MLGLDRGAARAAWTVFLIALSLLLLYHIRKTVFVFIGALLLAYLLSPLVDLICRLLPRRAPRTLALTLVYLVLIALVVFVGFTLGMVVASQATILSARLPSLFQRLQEPFSWNIPNWLKPLAANVVSAIQSSAQQSLPFFQRAGHETLAFLTNAVYLLLVPILAFFFLNDAAGLRESILKQFEEGSHRALLEDILTDMNVLLANYVRALVLLCLATFSAYSIFFSIAGVPFALLVATLAGFLEFIPMIGPFAAGVTILLVAWFNGYHNLLLIFLFLMIYRGFQDYILAPKLMGREAELHPILVIFGVLAGEQIGGIPGIFLSVPVIATLRIIYRRYQKARIVARTMVE